MPYETADLWNTPVKRKKYLITAGLNKYERLLYLSEYKDCEEWKISIVPIPMSKATAIKLIKKVESQLPEIRIKYPRKYSLDMKFDIIEFNDPYEGDLD